ncbi:MFS transporter [Pseudomonas syringae]|uniref:Aminotransferase class III n=1 Tax=Pseudomonas syringae CC1557 TaxID=1357279 RepID=W0MVM2_PSESX|nr:MFS transporter [Pseudomonas syringae]AHG41265.1 aminotransferase class III [Pseudomonas syringae CC1557]MBI6739451.1 MFS transporter [Pseudomonas syringae]MBI6746121.1 MFS transporter [Pseudomonas syringae]MBI6760220.1 MFS transporter [Pseudomonas syringae]MBI6766512.1 MFS transporter [Pseudomonas syringae]
MSVWRRWRSFKGFDLGRSFYFLWSGESLAIIGMALTEFALGVWVYTSTGSAFSFAGVVLAATLPAVLFLPLAGGLADRVSHRLIIICCDVSLALLLSGVIGLLWFDRLELVHMYIFNCMASIVSAFRTPAYQAAVSEIVSPQKYTQASGLMGITKNASSLVAPLLAGMIIAKAGLASVLMVDLLTFCSGTLLVIKAFSHLRPVQEHGVPSAEEAVFSGALSNVMAGLKFFAASHVMTWLLVYTVMRSALLSLVTLMMTPLLLSTLGSDSLGMAYTWAALGGLFGAGVLVSMSNRRRLMVMAVIADLLLSICIIVLGLVSQTVSYCAVAFCAIMVASIADAGVTALWMSHIPVGNRASVFALISMLTIVSTSLAIFFGGLLVDHWFGPALSLGGVYADSIGVWLGVGEGRGVGLLFVVTGAGFALLALGALLYGPLRRLEGPQSEVSDERVSDTHQIDAL